MNWEELIEQLTDFGAKGMEQTGLPAFLIALLFSLLSALFVAYLYSVFYRSRASGSQVHRAFPLLGISITAIFITIQFSLPLSLGLLGALSIVRFRTPIKEPEEIAFLMLVVATSLSCATFNLLFLALVLGAAVLALLIMRQLRAVRRATPGHGMVVVTHPTSESESTPEDSTAALIRLLTKELPLGRLDSVTDHDGLATVTYRFAALEAERIPGLRAEVRKLATGAGLNIYFDRAGGV